MSEIKYVRVGSFEAFLGDLEKRSNIRTVKLDDHGLSEPRTVNGATWIQPRIRIVVTALDVKNREILIFEKTWDTGSTNVEFVCGAEKNPHTDRTGLRTRAEFTEKLQAYGYNVVDGEWTIESATRALTPKSA